ncbi:MAG: biotin transporter BioY [Lachnospiraceae bacterium]|nr:biotin transporter BioY [Lachnospiraceae bacterium]
MQTDLVNNRKKIGTIDMAYIAIGAVLIAICSWISIPVIVPFTLQTFAVFLLIMLFGGMKATISVLIYILVGAVGVPVFAGFGAGIGVLFGKTGGYIIGFLSMGPIFSLITKLFGKKLLVQIVALLTGLLVCYAFGTAWFMYIYMRDTGDVGLMTVLSWCVFPYIVPDAAKMAVAVLISKKFGGRIRR